MSVKSAFTELASAVRAMVGVNYAMTPVEMEQLIRNAPDSSYMRMLVEKDMTSLVVPGISSYIRKNFMRGAPNLETVIVLKGVLVILHNAFSECPKLTSVSLPNTLQTLGNSVFWASGLQTINLPTSLRSIGEYTFGQCPLSSITIPEGMTSLAGGLFQSCDHLTTVSLPASLLSIGAGAFQFCNALRAIVLPANISTIGASALPSGLVNVYCRFRQNSVAGAPWGASFAQIHYNYTGE